MRSLAVFHGSARQWPAVLLVVSFAVSPVVAETAGPVNRIEQMRDQSGVVAGLSASADASTLVRNEVGGSVVGLEVQQQQVSLPANESLPLGAAEGDLFEGASAEGGGGSLGDGWLLSTLAALGVVLALVFGIRWVLRRGGVVSSSVSQGAVVEVLSRTTVAPRNHVLLMRVGQRILVVSDSPAGMRTLTSIHEAEEVADLLGAVDAAKPSSVSQSFGTVMKKLSNQWSAEADDDLEEEGVPVDRQEHVLERAEGALARVRGRLAALSDAGGRA